MRELLENLVFESFFSREEDEDDREKPEGSIAKGIEFRQSSVENEIEELRSMPEFESLEDFVESKLDSDEFTYNFVELQAIARNETAKELGHDVSAPTKRVIDSIRNLLEKEMGFKFVQRTPSKNTRGVRDPTHGTPTFAGMGGGSGFGSEFSKHVSGFTSMGGGAGAIGGKYDWSSSDSRNLSMGSRRR